eukprot:425414-Pleurochrysis_carterae.AAC.1
MHPVRASLLALRVLITGTHKTHLECGKPYGDTYNAFKLRPDTDYKQALSASRAAPGAPAGKCFSSGDSAKSEGETQTDGFRAPS